MHISAKKKKSYGDHVEWEKWKGHEEDHEKGIEA